MPVFIADLLARLGKARSMCDAGRNEDARQTIQALERDIVAEENKEAPGVEGTVVGFPPPFLSDADDADDAPVPPDDDVTRVAGEPPVPGEGS